MSNDLVARAMSFIFESDKHLLKDGIIAILRLHQQPSAGQPFIDLMNLGVRYGDTIWTHPERPKQQRGGPTLTVVNCFPEHGMQAKNLLSDIQLLEKDTKRAQKTLTQLVRGMNTDQDLRDSFSDIVATKLGLAHLSRTRPPAFRYEKMEPRIHANIIKDLDMIDGYFNARALLI
jgi:hypothetical protein